MTEVPIRSPLRNEAVDRKSFQGLSGDEKPPVKLGKAAALKAGRTKASGFWLLASGFWLLASSF
tara:strand:+ start:480 stop:671 length:192 start_codon:yes stop_codon:yes gene_type:complete